MSVCLFCPALTCLEHKISESDLEERCSLCSLTLNNCRALSQFKVLETENEVQVQTGPKIYIKSLWDSQHMEFV